MSRRGKLKKFADVSQDRLVIELGTQNWEKRKGNWSQFFENDNPIILELGCGYGEYTIGLAEKFPNQNFIGIDIKGARIWQGCKQAYEKKLTNVGFVRINILEIDHFFDENEVDEIWITFPDPRSRDSDEKRRLTNARYLKLYSRILKKNGMVHLKTDSTFLYEYSIDLFKNLGFDILYDVSDLYASDNLMKEHYGLKTRFEKMFTDKGEDIKYIRFKMDGEKLEHLDFKKHDNPALKK